MARSRFVLAAGACSALALTLAACGNGDSNTNASDNDWPTELTFVSIPSEESTSLIEEFDLVIEVLQDELGVTITAETATDYAAVIEAMRAENADIANFGPFSFVVAADSGAGAVPVAVVVSDPDQPPSYVSYGIVAADNDEINSLEDYRGQRVCFVDQVSTSGFLYPSAGLMAIDIDPENDITPVFSGGHDASALAVINGDCDAGFAYDTMIDELMIERGQIEGDELKVVWESEDIPSAPFAANENTLPADMIEEMRRIFLEQINLEWLAENGYCDTATPEDCSIPGTSNAWGFVEANDAVFDGIRAVCEITQADACQV